MAEMEPLFPMERQEDSLVAHIVVPRREIEAGEPDQTLKALTALNSDRETALRFQNKVILSFQGYDDDSQGVFQFNSVCDFVRKLNEKWYAWFFFMTKDVEFSPLAVIALCCCPRLTKLPSGICIPPKDELAKFLSFQFTALRYFCESFGLTRERTEAEVQGVMDYFMRVGWVGGCDTVHLSVHSAKTERWVRFMRATEN
jgi:hypothetical protein